MWILQTLPEPLFKVILKRGAREISEYLHEEALYKITGDSIILCLFFQSFFYRRTSEDMGMGEKAIPICKVPITTETAM